MAEPSFWDDKDAADLVIDQLKDVTTPLNSYEEIGSNLEDMGVYIELYEEERPDNYKALHDLAESIDKALEELKVRTLLDGEYDKNGAVVSIHAGTGGTDAQDWAEMLYRMYTRWASDHDYKLEVIDYLADTEGGIRSVYFKVLGAYAYGFLKAERGVHRLVRISPFDAQKKRHTSFASVDVFPDIDETIAIDIKEEDLKIDYYRSQGAGGQSVNTTDSAVRITHIPTGVVATCQNERSQKQNKEVALRILYGKLVQLKEEERKKTIDELTGDYSQIAWGSQIRSYIFNPYMLVKDHRTDVENFEVQKVIDGDIDKFIYAYLDHVREA